MRAENKILVKSLGSITVHREGCNAVTTAESRSFDLTKPHLQQRPRYLLINIYDTKQMMMMFVLFLPRKAQKLLRLDYIFAKNNGCVMERKLCKIVLISKSRPKMAWNRPKMDMQKYCKKFSFILSHPIFMVLNRLLQ